MEQWLPLQEYPGYSISDQGRVRNDKRDRLLAVTQTYSNHVYVGLSNNGVQVKRAVSKLVAEAFIPPSKYRLFTTPIHFDGDVSNCRADNMDWRPRWFANKHTMQFKRNIQINETPIREINTNETFETCWDAILKYGLLYNDMISSIHNKTYVFPTMQTFEWL